MLPEQATCPQCRQRAPFVLRGLEVRCAVCGGKRSPFGATALQLAGKPSRIGGVAAKVAGCGMLTVGTALAIGLGLLLQTLVGGYAGLAIAIPIVLLSFVPGIALLLGGRSLRQSGERAARSAQLETVRALAAHRAGDVTAAQAAQALGISAPDADALLTEMARDPVEQLSLDFDDDGTVHYLFGEQGLERRWGDRLRIAPASDAAAQPSSDWQAWQEAAAAEEAARQERRRR